MSKVFLTSDTHFGHSNIIGYSMRPFFRVGVKDSEIQVAQENRNFRSIVDVSLHDEMLIKNWNAVVSNGDFVYHLGDFSFGNQEHYLKKLNGRIIFIRGNHDKEIEKLKHLFYCYYEEAPVNRGISIDGEKYVLCHYPMWSWNCSFHGRIHFFGHVHSSPIKRFYCARNSYDVGVDNNEYKPIRLEEAVEKAKSNPLSINISQYLNAIGDGKSLIFNQENGLIE